MKSASLLSQDHRFLSWLVVLGACLAAPACQSRKKAPVDDTVPACKEKGADGKCKKPETTASNATKGKPADDGNETPAARTSGETVTDQSCQVKSKKKSTKGNYCVERSEYCRDMAANQVWDTAAGGCKASTSTTAESEAITQCQGQSNRYVSRVNPKGPCIDLATRCRENSQSVNSLGTGCTTTTTTTTPSTAGNTPLPREQTTPTGTPITASAANNQIQIPVGARAVPVTSAGVQQYTLSDSRTKITISIHALTEITEPAVTP